MANQRKHNLRLFGDIMGLSPLRERLKQAKIAVFGEEDVPSSKFGLSSLKQLYPIIAPKMWRGKFHIEKTVLISNLFNHTQTPIENGWDVQKTQTKDFRGKKLTYNSHNGTDFAIPVGTIVCTAAEGKVVQVHSEFNRGGLKIYIDHGDGLMTTYAHLAKSFVKVGDIVKRGQKIALSGYSGIDAMITFPFGIPHVHFNVWLNNEPIDPFPSEQNPTTMWLAGKLPNAVDKSKTVELLKFEPSKFEESTVKKAIAECKTEKSRDRINAIEDVYYKAFAAIIEMNYYPTRFRKRVNLYGKNYKRSPRLDLPFKNETIQNLVFIDEL